MQKKRTNSRTLLGADYSTERFFEAVNDGTVFRLTPKKIPIWKFFVGFIIFQTFGFGLGAFLFSKGNEVHQITPYIATYLIPPIFTIILFIVYTFIIYFVYRNQQKKGDVLVYRINDKVIELPRENIEVPVSDIFLQVVTGWVSGNQNNKSKVSELQIVCKTDKNQRWAIMGSISSFMNAFDYIIDDIRQSIPIEIKK